MNASETCESIDRPDLEELNTSEYIAPFFLGTIHILRKHIFRIFGPPSPYVSMVLVVKISKNWHFLTPSPQVLT